MLQHHVERDLAAHGAADEDGGRAVRHSVQHRHQVLNRGVVLPYGPRLAEAGSAVGDGLVRLADAPHRSVLLTTVASVAVEEDDGLALPDRLGGEKGAARGNVTDPGHALILTRPTRRGTSGEARDQFSTRGTVVWG